MSLATRCTACGTAFRVVQDQLKVSEGWVRCGRCSEVFNALEGLFDLERDTPTEWHRSPPTGPVGAGAPTPARRPTGATAAVGDDAAAPSEPAAALHARDPDRVDDAWAEEARESEDSLDKEIDAHLFGARHAARRRAPAAQVSERDRIDFSDARFDSDLLADAADDDAALEPLRGTHPADLPLESATPPEFVRRAENRARWQRPRVRAGLAIASLALFAALGLQAANHFRDLLAARWPPMRPALAEWCAIADCTIEAPRRIEDITVESTALARAPGTDSFSLAVTLRSRASVPVAMPWVDLSLTDASGKLVARKALGSREFNRVAMVLQPGTEVVLQTLLAARNVRVTGYTVEIFYP